MRYFFGDCVLDTQRYELHSAGEPIKLRRKMFQVLAYLLDHRDRVVSKQELLEHVWPEQFVSDAVLKACMTALRKALGERGRSAHFVRTLHGQGYRFVAAVEVRAPLPVDAMPCALTSREGEGEAPDLTLRRPPPQPSAINREGEDGPGEQQRPPGGGEAQDGEHKQVTVLCGALAEATVLAARLGPEAMYHVMRDVLALVQEMLRRYGGSLMQVSGEGFVALFGAPVAYEDHARRAVLSAFDLRQHLRVPDAIRGQPHGLAVRLGLHTGPVVVGTLRHDAQRPYTALGDTLALATRLQHQAAPDTILLSAATYALAQAEVQGEAWVAGPSDPSSTPVAGYVVRGLRWRRAGVPQRGAQPWSRFVGRARELALLHERLALAASGQGQVIGIAGEPGMGKSRLLAEFAHSLDGQSVTYCEGHCLTYGSATPYLLVCGLLRQLCGLADTAPREVITTTIQQRLHEAGIVSEEETLLLLQLLDGLGEAAALAALRPEVRRARTFVLVRQLFLHARQHQPLVLAVENLPWIDPTSDEWLAALAAQAGGAGILLLATYRSGYRLPWLAHSWATQIALPPLTPHESLTVVHAVPQAMQLPDRQHQAIVAQAAGNPFFLEELTWAAVAHGDQARPLPLPDTIQAVLAARLDRLPQETKRLVQIAAVIGPEVPVRLLQQIAGLTEEALQRGLACLQETELLYETRLFPEPVYTFKHALTHEVAYSSLLQAWRRALHAQIVDRLETLAGDRQDEVDSGAQGFPAGRQDQDQADRLAHHAMRGEVWDKALRYYRQAGARAFARLANREAVTCFEQALVALQHLPECRDTIEQAIDLHFDLRAAFFVLGDLDGSLHCLRQAAILAEAIDDQHRLGQIFSYMTRYAWQVADYDRAIASGQRALTIATALGDVGLQVMTHCFMGQAYYFRGDYRRAVDVLRKNVTCLAGNLVHERFGLPIPAAVHSHTWLVASLAELGAFAEGRAYSDTEVRIAAATDHPYSRAHAHLSVGQLSLRQGDLARAISTLEQGVELCQIWNIQSLFGIMTSLLGVAYARSGCIADALPILEQVVGQTHARLGRGTIAPYVLKLGEAYLLASRLDEAHTHAERALQLAGELQEQGHQAYALHLLGDIAARREPLEHAPAEGHYRQALALAEELGMRPLQAHCHLGLGTLYATTGWQEPARTALAAAMALYRAMEMTWWLPQAEAALVHVG